MKHQLKNITNSLKVLKMSGFIVWF